jgi:protein TonB
VQAAPAAASNERRTTRAASAEGRIAHEPPSASAGATVSQREAVRPEPRVAPQAQPSTTETPLPAAPDYARGVRLDPGPRPLDDIEPDYPDPIHLREGTVVLRLLISDTGHVDDVAVVRSQPRGVFEQAAVEAFAKARFAPGMAAGTPVKSQITVEVQFVPINRGARVSGRTY